MQIYESCLGNLYVCEDGYIPETCETCGNSDLYIGSYIKGDVQKLSDIVIQKLDFYGGEHVKEILKLVDQKTKLSEEEKEKIKQNIQEYLFKNIEEIFDWE